MGMFMVFFRTIFSSIGLIIVIYVLIGVFHNTAAPHIPGNYSSATIAAHSWVQYLISIMSWPLSFWSPTFTTGKWTP